MIHNSGKKKREGREGGGERGERGEERRGIRLININHGW
jgi:hypothetical protein